MRGILLAAALLAALASRAQAADAAISVAAADAAITAKTADATVTIDNFSFAPAELTVAAGTKVSWLNRDDIPHQVVGVENPKELKSPPLDTDDHYEYVFAKPGVYHYFCSLHAHMQGTVVVK